MSDLHPSVVAALANPAKADEPPVKMAVVQTVAWPAVVHKDEEGKETVLRPAMPIGRVRQIVMLVPGKTSFQAPQETALIPAAGLKIGDVATQEQMASVLGATQGVSVGATKA